MVPFDWSLLHLPTCGNLVLYVLFHRRYAMPFTPSLRLIGWLMALVCSHLRTFVLVTRMPLRHCACLMEEEGGVSDGWKL